MPKWRNGRRTRLKILRGQLHVGSSPTFGTNYRLKSLFFLCNKSDNPKLMGLERAGYRKVASGKFSLPRRDSVAEQVPLSAPNYRLKSLFFLCYPKAKLKLDYIFSIDKISATHNC